MESEPLRTGNPELLATPAPPEAVAAKDGSFPTDSQEPPGRELVPDVSLDEYVRKFRYEPPRDAAEVTMRGDLPPVEVPSSQPAAASPAVVISDPPAPATSVPVPEDIDSRLGLQPETSTEARIARPRFLDINEPSKTTSPEPRGDEAPATGPDAVDTLPISGPSFLGLSESPRSWADAVGVEEGEYAPRRSHWRAWSALAILLLFGWLGWLQYRSQVQQSNNGPVEVMRVKLREWKQMAMAQIDKNLTPPPLNPSEPENKPQSQPSASPQPKQNTEAQSNAASPPQPTAEESHRANSPDGTTPSVSPSTQSSNSTSATATEPNATPDNFVKPPATVPEKSQPKTQAGNPRQSSDAGTSQTKASKNGPAQPASPKPAPGAEEMAKAKNASDSAATAAWLWKATAKGNPDAPVELANMYIQGNGVPRSCEQAMVLLKTAAAKENALARNRLGSLYATGTCVPPSRVEAYRWYSSSLTVNPDSEWTQQTRDLIWRQMTPDERALAQRYR